MSAVYQKKPAWAAAPDSVQQHREWLALVEVTGPFLSLPVLRSTWPSLDAIDKDEREELRRAHGEWRTDPDAGQRRWIEYILRDLLGWGSELRFDGLDPLAVTVPEHDTTLTPSFVLVEPGTETGDVKPDATRLLGMLVEPGAQPTARIRDSAWAATPVDRLAQLCRHHGIELGLATDGRWWGLVWAPRGKVTTTAVFDAVAWNEAAERIVVRAFRSLLGRIRFFGVTDEEQLTTLLEKSEDAQEDITEALGVQVRQAVELLVAAIGRHDVLERKRGNPGLADVDAHEVYRGAVSVMMRIVFLLFAEERRLLPSDNELYARAYSAGRLCAELEQRALEGSENELESYTLAWHRLLALFRAVHDGVDHPRLPMHAHDGSLFDPEAYPWFPLDIDDRTVLHMLRAVQYVEIGTGKNRERRTLSFRQLDVEQIGYVYEGLLSYEGFRAGDVVVGLVGKAGLEDEVSLTELEELAARHRGRTELAAALADRYKNSRVGSAKAIEKKLGELDPQQEEDARKKLLAVVEADDAREQLALVERLLPFYGVIRTDLRELPVVILPGALYITESKLRKNTGTHYTPRKLATEVVEHALEPLLYHVGPLQTADRSQWRGREKTSDELLQLKVADIAMGSAAFLVAAARYLGDALLDAWTREGKATSPEPDETRPLDADEDPLVVEARRQVIEHCLYGVDINPMAVEMAKLSLWLVSMDPQRPFTFLDDRLVAGDSLLGITSLEQLEFLHMDPAKGREIHHDIFGWTAGIREQVAAVADLRKQISEIELGDDPIGALEHKRALLEEAQLATGRLRLFADLAVGAAVAHAGRGHNGLAAGSIATAKLIDDIADSHGEVAAREQRKAWLRTDQPDGAFDRWPLHWPLMFPEVFEAKDGRQGGFDAVIGNPPFLGGKKISGATGSAYREHLVHAIGRGVKGNADLIAYFVLRAHAVLNPGGQTGLIATNTLAQGDTREVGLDQLLASGVVIRRATKSEPWPSKSVVLEYCALWTTFSDLGHDAERVADGSLVSTISSSLQAQARVTGSPERLLANKEIAFIGSFINGIGFVLKSDEAADLIRQSVVNREVLAPYLGGEDLNTSPDQQARRWIVDFGDRDLEDAARYSACMRIVRERVKPKREALPDYKRRVRDNWWKYEHQAKPLYLAISEMRNIIAAAIHTSTVMPLFVEANQIYSHGLVIFVSDDAAFLALLSSAAHYWWAVYRGSSIKADLRYTPSDVFETFPLPDLTLELRELGERLNTYRRSVMLSRRTGLTKTYNLVFDPSVHDDDIAELRRIHQAIDEATVRAYGWDDLLDQLDHGFHPAGRDLRWTVGPAAQREILDRLLELNHELYAAEVAAGLHDKGKKGAARRAAKPKPAAPEGLF
jgi:hypothetical protein